MSQPRISILIPVYNVERYLRQCLDSVVAQTLRDIEIICINDGSRDGSLAIMQEFAQRDSRIRIIDKANGGYGQAMNRGLDAACGEFVGIVESDDYVDPETFQTMYEAARRNDAEVVKCEFYLTWTTPRLREKRVSYMDGYPQRTNTIVNPASDYQIMWPQPAIWSAIYRLQLLREHHIRFLETPGASFQDTSFGYKVWAVATRVFLLDRAFVHYRQDNSASSINATTKINAVEQEFDEYFNFLSRYPHKQKYLIPIMQNIVYKTYRWNLSRIDQRFRADYVHFMYAYFKKRMEAGFIDPQFFELRFYDELKLLLADPHRYLKLVNSPVNAWLFRHGHGYHLFPGGWWESLRDGGWYIKHKLLRL
ncbi:MAG: glycosyltransferase [Coriobacteriales bacterium]|jgi:glycosyltransferase involved in cell wall biosynthesis|nr:glycosyltransferase [Coriobacteriales bacterium]